MEELIISCQTGERTRRKFTAAEVSQRQTEIAKAEQDEAKRELDEARQEMLDAHAELATANDLLQAGQLTMEDIAKTNKRATEARKRWEDLQAIEPIPLEE